MENNKVLLAGYPRSGNTWLGYMLSYLLNAQYVEPYNWVAGHTYDLDERVISLTSGGLGHSSRYKLVIKTHNLPRAEKLFLDYPLVSNKIILIIRDPRDVAVSMYFFDKNIVHDHNLKSIFLPLSLVNNMKRHRFFHKTFISWREHTSRWLKESPCVVRYEDLLMDAPRQLANVLTYLGEQPTDFPISQCCELFMFDKLKSVNKHSEKFYRRGTAKDYMNHFTATDYRNYKATCQDLAEQHGYATKM